MPDLVVEFTHAADGIPIEEGSEVRTETIAIAAAGSDGPAVGSIVADRENVADLRAAADCWIEIGSDPQAAADRATSRFMASGERRQFRLRPGHRISVVAAA